MENSTLVTLEIISVISVLIGLVIFIVFKTIEIKDDLEDIYNEQVPWYSALFYTLAPVWVVILAILTMIVLIFAFCGVCNFITYMR